MPRAHTRPLVHTLYLELLEDRVVPAGLIGDLVVFGDSLSDVGNVAIATGGATPPSDFYFQGRFSGGPIWVDTLAEYLGETTPTPFLAGGLNYAFGGAPVIADLNPDEVTAVPTITQQVGLYLLGGHTPEADDLFTIWAGANDFFDAAGAYQAGDMTLAQVFGVIPQAVTSLGNNIELLHSLGGKQFVVANLPALGQTPYFLDNLELAQLYGTPDDIVAAYGAMILADSWAEAFNGALAFEVGILETSLGIDIIELDISQIFDTLRNDNPLDLGNLIDAVGPYNAAGFLTDITAANPNDYLFHDSVHPGSPAQQYIGLQAAAGVLEQLGVSTVLVKTTADTIDPLDGKISLREAVNLANAQAGEQTILFALGNGNKTISLGGELAITGATNILGPGTSKLTISGQNASRIFSIGAEADVTLSGMTLRNGRAEQGGAIFNAGNLTVVDVTFRDNTASGANASGGAIHNTGNLVVWLSAFQGNSAVGTDSAFGGAIASVGPNAHTEVILSHLTNNEARAPLAQGGAIYVGAGSSLNLVASVVTGNKARATSGGQAQGGGIYVASDALFSQFLSVVSGNNATTAGKNVFQD